MSENWGKISAILSVAAVLIAALFWIFQVSAKADEALRIANEAKVLAASKADADDIQRLDQDVRDLRKSLEERDLIDHK